MFATRCHLPSVAGIALATAFAVLSITAALADPLPSWNEGPTKAAIVTFVERVTTEGSSDFVPIQERIAVFDNDGTLWVEQPVPAQVAFELACVSANVWKHPDWDTTQPFKAALAGDTSYLAGIGERGFAEILVASHEGWATDDYQTVLMSWMADTRDARFGRPSTDLVYQPMLEVIDYFRRSGFEIYIVSGNSADFMRPWVASVYGIQPDHVIGSTIRTKYEFISGRPQLTRLPEMSRIGDGAGRPAGFYESVGRRPIAAFGNADIDFEMLQWTTTAPGPRLGVVIHHTDAQREYAYDRNTGYGLLDAVLEAAGPNGWLVVDVRKDWKSIFPFETQ
ncbi:haloacid dehalogenase-like hydrolase [Mesorhizobium sp. M4A.F.Ca.ET.022.05.2.1]|uniref:HAD family hydrolase n=1 Tax=Mesorhizobium sp. M4A.F.Ca.ET.022.05.2.1 TaxID=2496653 RepID=UPI000FC9FDBF|nr:HAD family hydrolase [Mesorhizobium sp. M4A.F.Ca.ET.022.05.2.1]RVC81783.1 haloacid dehalogenase-like hydrolase [Mesorhizobium sp. M4A.F.Ca.ET.022.05.2.1]